MRKQFRRALWLALVLTILGLGTLTVRLVFHGPRLARLITERYVNPYIRGRLEIDSIQWSAWGLATGLGKVPLSIDGIRIYDPQGKQVLDVPKATARFHLLRLLGGKGDLFLDDLRIARDPESGRRPWCVVEEIELPPKESEVGLLAAFQNKEARRPSAERAGPIHLLNGISLSDVDLTLDFVAWKAVLSGARTRNGWLRNSMRTRENDFTFSLSEVQAKHVSLEIGRRGAERYRFELEHLHSRHFAIEPEARSALAYDVTADTEGRGNVHAMGELRDIYGTGGVDLTLDLDRAGTLAYRLSKGAVQGDHMAVHATLTGRYEEGIDIGIQASGVELSRFPLEAAHISAGLHTGSGKGAVHDLRLRLFRPDRPKGSKDENPPLGEARIAGTFDLEKEQFRADIEISDPIDLSSFTKLLPPDQKKYVALVGPPKLWGHVAIKGSPRRFKINPKKPVQLHIGEARISGDMYVDDLSVLRVPEKLKLRIGADWVRIDSAALSLGQKGQKGQKGKTRLEGGSQLTAQIRFRVGRLATWLSRLGIGASSALTQTPITGQFSIQGSESKGFRSQVVLQNTWLNRLHATLHYAKDTLHIIELRAAPMGGRLSATGKVLFGPSIRLTSIHVLGEGLRLDRLPAAAQASSLDLGGALRMELSMNGPIGRPNASLFVTAEDLSVLGQPIGDLNARASLSQGTLHVEDVSIAGPLGGPLSLAGTVDPHGALNLNLDLPRLLLARLPLGREELLLDGYAAFENIRIGGSLKKPTLTGGHVRLYDVALRDSFLGGGQLDIRPWPQGVAFDGQLFQSKVRLSGNAALREPYSVELRLELRRVELDEVFPELSALLGAHAWVTGTAALRWGSGGTASAHLHLRDVVVLFDTRDPKGLPLTFRNAEPVEIAYADGVLKLGQPMRLIGEAGEVLTLSGSYGRREGAPPSDERRFVDVTLDGQADLALLKFFTSRFFEETRGRAEVHLGVRGELESLQPTGKLDVQGAAVRFRGQEGEVNVPRGLITLEKDRVRVQDLQIEMDGAEANLGGFVELSDFAPRLIDLQFRGRLAAKLLELIPATAEHISASSGSAEIDVKVQGAVSTPNINGTLVFDRPFEIASRALHRDIVLSEGAIRFSSQSTPDWTSQEIGLRDVRGTVDGERLSLGGNPEACSSRFCTALRLSDWTFQDVHLVLSLESLSHRIPDVLETEVATRDLVLSGDAEGLELSGTVRLVDGRFLRNYNIFRDGIEARRTGERATPFWKGRPLWENLRLDLLLQTTGMFQVDNNLADLELAGELALSGTLAEPRFGGQIDVLAGSINLKPVGIRPRFDLAGGTSIVSFDPQKEFPERTPALDLRFEADFVDRRTQQRHLIYLTVSGTLDKILPELRTNTGLGNAETMLLVTTGEANVDEFVRGTSTTAPSSDSATQIGGSSSGIYSTVDTLLKEHGGTLISGLFDDKLTEILPLDCVLVQPSPESVRVELCKKLANERFLWEGEFDQGYRGQYLLKTGFKLQLSDEWSIDSYYLRDSPAASDETREIEQRLRLQGKLRYVLP